MAETPLSPDSAAADSAIDSAAVDGSHRASGGDADPAANEAGNNRPEHADGAEVLTAIDDLADHGSTGAPPASEPSESLADGSELDAPAVVSFDAVATPIEPMTAPEESQAPATTSESPATAPDLALPEPVPAPVAEPAGIATTIAVPPLETSADASEGDGGEWELLVGKINAWFGSGELNRQWQKIQGPLKGVTILIGAILALQLYATVVGTIDGIPLVSGLLELAGLIALGNFGLTKMVKTSEREQVVANWKRRWQTFRGND